MLHRQVAYNPCNCIRRDLLDLAHPSCFGLLVNACRNGIFDGSACVACPSDICLCTIDFERFCFSLTASASLRLRLGSIGITGGGPGLPILSTGSRRPNRIVFPRYKSSKVPEPPLAKPQKTSIFPGPERPGTSFTVPWLDCCFHPTAACATAVEERLQKEGYSIDACSSLSLSVGDSSFIVRLPELVLFTHFASDCRIAVAELLAALKQRQQQQLLHTQQLWGQRGNAGQAFDRAWHQKTHVRRRERLEDSGELSRTAGEPTATRLQPLLLLHVRVALPTLIFAGVEPGLPPPVVVSCGLFKVGCL